ncbi:hypothetical protein [Lactonifactor longoviformis]|nr:hypothetical protein [Lactonifactor longoviformis]
MYSSQEGIIYAEHWVNELREALADDEDRCGFKYLVMHIKVTAIGKMLA